MIVYTFITIFDGSLNRHRQSLYEADHQFFDKPYLDNKTGNLHMIWNYTVGYAPKNTTVFVELSKELDMVR